MKAHYKTDPWSIIEVGFDPLKQEASESIFSLGNGWMGQRANFEEQYSGESLQGTYLAGVYYPDKTRVGWWKNGYPEYFAKVLNAPNWIGIDAELDGQQLDLHQDRPLSFRRELNMKEGYLDRSFSIARGGGTIEVSARRFLSMDQDEIGAIRYSIRSRGFNGKLRLTPYIDGDVANKDSNYDEKFWEMLECGADGNSGYLKAITRKTGFISCMSMECRLEKDGKDVGIDPAASANKFKAYTVYELDLMDGEEVTLYKYVSVLTSMNFKNGEILTKGAKLAAEAADTGFDILFAAHAAVWEQNWAQSDIRIDGDIAAQQGIRFNIFQLNQTYTGKDERLNIGPKGFTGEKYGGSTYWDTEAYMLPFYLSTAQQEVARNLLVYRYKHLDKAIENAARLGFDQGAALYPMVTMNGEECHNEWEITFEEIHRNGAIAFAIFMYIRYTGDEAYLADYGLEVLIGISRFWRQRVNWSDVKGRYVMLGVTGPNEYENNVNNNWYTNKMASWTLSYTMEAMEKVMESDPAAYKRIVEKASLNVKEECEGWKDVVENLYFPFDENKGVFLQQDGFMDKKQRMAADLDPAERPINQHWSWDRILRSVFIKQADVLQGIYVFEDEFDKETIARNFDFYEPRTVHESSLSPCVHSILAARLGRSEKAYEMYLRTSRLDLDDYNHEVDEGLHITSMGGTWMSVVHGFGGMSIREGLLSFEPHLPESWKSLNFKILYRGRTLKVDIREDHLCVENLEGDNMELLLSGKRMLLKKGGIAETDL